MYEKHWLHHNHTGIVNRDPDFHDGQHQSLLSWYLKFMWEYFSIAQISKVGLWANFLMFIFAVPFINIFVYMMICGLCSSFRLFYFGTYLPHRPTIVDGKTAKTMPWRKSRSSNANRLISFLCCYHFDYHWEHHRWPYVPWWDLWKCKEIQRTISSS
jgi:beta-carotene/zeaxanthin 4-ketolase